MGERKHGSEDYLTDIPANFLNPGFKAGVIVRKTRRDLSDSRKTTADLDICAGNFLGPRHAWF